MAGEKLVAALQRADGLSERITLLERRDALRRIVHRQGGSMDRTDADFREADHPRETDGRFGVKGAGSPNQQPAPEKWVGKGGRPPFSREEIEHLPHSATHSGIKTLDDLARKGPEGMKHFVAGLHSMAREMGMKTSVARPEDIDERHVEDEHIYLIPAGMKAIGPGSRGAQKTKDEYKNNAGKLKDFYRATIATNDVDDIRRAVEALEKQGFKLAQKPKDNFSHPQENGYRDMNLIFRLPKTGMIAEVQFHVKHILAAKNQGHKLYEVTRDLEAKYEQATNSGPKEHWAPEDTRSYRETVERSNSLYNEAWTAWKGQYGRKSEPPG